MPVITPMMSVHRRRFNRISALCASALLVGATACSRFFHERETSGPELALDKAIEQAGGEEALGRARAFIWDGDAVVRGGGRTVHITGKWSIEPPEKAIVSTYDVSAGAGTMSHLVVNAPHGWLVRDGQFRPMPPAILENELDAFQLYDIMRLVSLRRRGVRLENFHEDDEGRRGIRAKISGRPDVDLFFDRSGRLRHFRTMVTDAQSGKPVPEDVYLERTITANGVKWPRDMRFTLDGKPYFDLTIKSLRVADKLRDKLLDGPP